MSGLPPVDVVVVGAGAAGLAAAYALSAGGASVRVLEARGRVGGRTLTLHPPPARGGGFDLGATWCWPHQRRILRLAAELQVDAFAQYETGRAVYDHGDGRPAEPFVAPPMPSLRLVGGAQVLCERMAARLGPERLWIEAVVRAVEGSRERVRVEGDRSGRPAEVEARFAVIALPPRLALHTLRFVPALPPELREVMAATPTWMGGAMKCVVEYRTAFWRGRGLSGLGISHTGPLGEIHDACTADGSRAALFGFFAGGGKARTLPPAERREQVLRQLARMFGAEAAEPLHYLELDWAREAYTSTADDAQPLREHPSYGDAWFGNPVLEGRVFWAGSETVRDEGGYLDGAVCSGEDVAQRILALR